MISRLRRRFIILAMASVAAVLVCLGVAINIAQNISTANSLDSVLQLIDEDESAFDIDDDYDREYWGRHRGDGMMFGRPITEETAYSVRWFSFTLEGDGEVEDANFSHIASVDASALSEFVAFVTQTSDGEGYFQSYRYLIVSDNEGEGQVASLGQSALVVSDERTAFFLDATDELADLRNLALLTAIVSLAAFLVIFVVVWFASRKVIEPFVEADARQKRFITDASHELKTPLAVIQTSLKVLELEVGRQKWIDKAEASSESMGALIDDMVTLSRLEEHVGSPETKRFDAGAVVDEVAESYRDFAAAHNHELVATLEQPLDYAGDPEALRKLVAVFLDNAVKYADPDAPITLSLVREGRRHLRLTCANAASALQPEQVEHLFDRFYRPDDARARESGGSGIGLSIAQSICEACGGQISATLTDDGVITFTALLK